MRDSATTIEEIRQSKGKRLAVLGHHYQSDEVLAHVDITGDSLELARRIEGLEAEDIVFCGVWFMAESAAILRRKDQRIHIPAPDAACPMADMARPDALSVALKILSRTGKTIVPLTYVNSSAEIKAVVGEWGGTVCTSANAKTMLQWARERGDAVLFLPDKHLAVNTADALDIPVEERHILNPGLIDGEASLFVKSEEAEGKTLLIWPGYCPIHDEFTIDSLNAIRKNDPEALVVVHPECPPEVTKAADANGSTSFIIKYVKNAPKGSTIYVATEANLVNRLAERHKDEKTVKVLETRVCDDMAKTTTDNLAAKLQELDTAAPVEVSESIAKPARKALERMLKACS